MVAPACPIINERVDESAVRVCAGLILTVVALSLVLPTEWAALLMGGLAFDFLLRGFIRPSLSPMGKLACRIARNLGLAVRPVNAGPKRFAAKLGCFFSLGMALTFLAGMPVASYVIGASFGLCAFLETAFGYCVGCKVYLVLLTLSRAEGEEDHL